MPRLAPARLARVQRVGQKQRAQTAAARAGTRHAKKRNARVAVKDVTRRARMTNAHAAVKVVLRLVAKAVRRLVARDAMERGWKLPLVVAVTPSHRLRAAGQLSHRVHPDR